MPKFLKELPARWEEMWRFIGESLAGDLVTPDPLDGENKYFLDHLVEKDPFDGIARR